MSKTIYTKGELIGILAALSLSGADKGTLRVLAVALGISWDDVLEGMGQLIEYVRS